MSLSTCPSTPSLMQCMPPSSLSLFLLPLQRFPKRHCKCEKQPKLKYGKLSHNSVTEHKAHRIVIYVYLCMCVCVCAATFISICIAGKLIKGNPLFLACSHLKRRKQPTTTCNIESWTWHWNKYEQQQQQQQAIITSNKQQQQQMESHTS